MSGNDEALSQPEPTDARPALSVEHIKALRFNAERAIDKCPLSHHEADIAYCGECGWAPSLLAVLDQLTAATQLAARLRVERDEAQMKALSFALELSRARAETPAPLDGEHSLECHAVEPPTVLARAVEDRASLCARADAAEQAASRLQAELALLKAAHVHPSVYIREEMDEREWGPRDVAAKWPIDDEWPVNFLAFKMLLAVGGSDPHVRLGAELTRLLGVAFDVEPEFFTNLENRWLAAFGAVTPDPATLLQAAIREAHDESADERATEQVGDVKGLTLGAVTGTPGEVK